LQFGSVGDRDVTHFLFLVSETRDPLGRFLILWCAKDRLVYAHGSIRKHR
jgi:hypothetical protein